MPWRVGIDEAGYGPNLGPLVLASSSCHVPDDCPASLWEFLRDHVRKSKEKADSRLLIDDSKKVNEGKFGHAALEAGVLSTFKSTPKSVRDLLQKTGLGDSLTDLTNEPWFDPNHSLPVFVTAEEKSCPVIRYLDQVTPKVKWGPIHHVAIPTPRFNELLSVWTVKSGVLATGVIKLLQAAVKLPGDDPVLIAIDKLGGRHHYLPMLSEAFPDCWPRAIREEASRCEYSIDGLSREVKIIFEPKADGNHLNVALASMAAKYLREVAMVQFNKYWLERVPNLAPTAGYPVDAKRFFAEIKGYLHKNIIEISSVWREK